MELELLIPRPADVCYRAFCDISSSRLWVPRLKKVRVVRKDDAGRAIEVSYEHEALSYALVYAYDDEARKVRWVPSAGVLDGVSGHAEFAPHPEGCVFRYALDSLRGRQPGHTEEVARAFAGWVSHALLP